MPWRRRVCAYQVVPFTCADDGLWVMEGETICFEHDLAMEIAEADCDCAAWVGIYALDHRGERLWAAPIASYGAHNPHAGTDAQNAHHALQPGLSLPNAPLQNVPLHKVTLQGPRLTLPAGGQATRNGPARH
ncbi:MULTISPECIES: hypothetical protein [unclassified Xanthobacter]|uniref:hypothetical protein n=1 Tax=unclassified Xanthobacter TaxID=2623496 RepID=UPI001EDF1989|nr:MULTISPECIES: hypothetical protein [unclassified Xanthobacter]